MNQWQPIETAPKSSEPILLFDALGRMAVESGYWAQHMLLECGYTHWMPLPPPPEEQK